MMDLTEAANKLTLEWITVEVQVLKDFKALTRPYSANLFLTEGWQRWMLPPGYANEYLNRVEISLEYAGRLHKDWVSVNAMLHLDNLPIGTMRPVAFHTYPTDTPSGLCHLTPVADDNHATLGGWHTITIRSV